MFKKSNRNFRTKKATDSESENETEKSPPVKPTPPPSAATVNPKTVSSVLTSQKILSFNDIEFGEHDDQESNSAGEGSATKEFQVKKSKESRRIMKELKKSKKEKEKILKMEASSSASQSTKSKQDQSLAPDTVLFNEGIKGTHLTNYSLFKVFNRLLDLIQLIN